MYAQHRLPWHLLLIVLTLAGLGSTGADGSEGREILRLERELHELERRRLEIERQIEAFNQEKMTLELEAAPLRQELQRLRNDARLVELEKRGQTEAAASNRRFAEIREANGELGTALKALELEHRQAVGPLLAEERELSLRSRENQAEGRRDHGSITARRDELRAEIEDIHADFRLRRTDLKRQLAELNHQRYALYLQQSRERGNTDTRDLEARVAQAVERRAAFEVEAVFQELENELRAEYREVRRAYFQASAEAQADLRPRFDAARADLQRLAMSRGTFREENRLKEMEYRLGGHLETLERKRLGADPGEAENLEEEIKGLRKAISELVENTLGAENGE